MCEAKRVGLHLRLDGSAHVWCGAKESVGRHRAVDALMRPLKIVVLDEEPQSLQAVREIGEYRLTQKLLPQRFPKPLDLAERLGMLWPTSAVRDAVAPQQLLKLRRPTPRGILPALIRQHLSWLSVLGDAALEGFDHQARTLVMRERPRHHVPRVVIHEADEVHALVAPHLEGEDVALPHLVGLRAFESALRFVTRLDHGLRRQQSFVVQDAPHRCLRHAEALEACEHVADSSCAPIRIRRTCRNDLIARLHLCSSLLPLHRRLRCP